MERRYKKKSESGTRLTDNQFIRDVLYEIVSNRAFYSRFFTFFCGVVICARVTESKTLP